MRQPILGEGKGNRVVTSPNRAYLATVIASSPKFPFGKLQIRLGRYTQLVYDSKEI